MVSANGQTVRIFQMHMPRFCGSPKPRPCAPASVVLWWSSLASVVLWCSSLPSCPLASVSFLSCPLSSGFSLCSKCLYLSAENAENGGECTLTRGNHGTTAGTPHDGHPFLILTKTSDHSLPKSFHAFDAIDRVVQMASTWQDVDHLGQSCIHMNAHTSTYPLGPNAVMHVCKSRSGFNICKWKCRCRLGIQMHDIAVADCKFQIIENLHALTPNTCKYLVIIYNLDWLPSTQLRSAWHLLCCPQRPSAPVLLIIY